MLNRYAKNSHGLAVLYSRQHTQNLALHAWHVAVHLLLVPEVV